MNKQLLPLALGGLAIGTTEFVMMGLLPSIATDFHISIPEAGYVISAYALGVVIGAPLLTALGSSMPPKRLLVLLMVIFSIFNTLSAFAPTIRCCFARGCLRGCRTARFLGWGR